MRLVLASNNAKKLGELAVLLAPAGVELVTQGSLGIAEADEPHHSFIENALEKARHAASAAGGAAIADDSGLCVGALGGAPGVISAHYATVAFDDGLDREARRRLQDDANNRLLLERLASHADRRGHYVSVLVAVRAADDPEPLIAVGRWHGVVLSEPRGAGGFGYDPLMFIEPLGCTVAEMSAELKNANSHRALAARELLGQLRAVWHLG